MLSAHEFAPTTRVPFAIDASNTAASLRRLADLIEAGEVTVASAQVQSLATAADFTSTLVRLKVYERRPAADHPAAEDQA